MSQNNTIQNSSSDREIKDKENWLNEHGHPSYKFLQSLADDTDPRAMEKLKSIAFDLDVNFGPNSTAEELIGSIRSATRSDPNTTT